MSFARARVAILALFGCAALASAAYWIRLGVPVDLVAAPGGRIACVSYAPFRKVGESPFTPGYVAAPERIDEDLKALSRRFDCVRTYSVGQGLDRVPEIARRYGMKVLLGAWLSRNAVENAGELADAIRVANANRDVVRAIVVGNEVLLRGELPQRTIAEHLRMVRAATGLPVTYADVWEFWLKYREVAPAVDFITIHILPYWEDEPVPIEHAIEHVDAIYRQMQRAFPGREFLIGETGWPSEGRQRWRSVPSRVNEARFFREFMRFVEHSHLPYNVIEAFDQPWKRALEGTVGGYWGLYDDDLRDKFALTGPVVEEPRWWIGLAAGAAGAAAFALFGLVVGAGRAGATVAAMAARVSIGFVVGAIGAAQVRHIVFANRDATEWALTGIATALAVVTASIVTEHVARLLAASGATGATGATGAERGAACAPMSEALSWSRPGGPAAGARTRGALLGFWLVAATIVNLLLIFDARYRDFPSLLFAPVVVAYAGLALARRDPTARGVREVEERLLVGALLAAAAVIVVMELPINLASDFWALLCVVFAASTWVNAATTRPAERL
jgi:glucan 1,3-beta-glucosidase